MKTKSEAEKAKQAAAEEETKRKAAQIHSANGYSVSASGDRSKLKNLDQYLDAYKDMDK